MNERYINLKLFEDRIKEGYAIAIIWDIDDVYAQAEEREIELTEFEAKDILQRMYKYHDANEGINWLTIDIVTDTVISKRSKPEDVIELCLCEQKHVLLKPNQFYKFVVDPNCSSCTKLAMEVNK